MHEYSNLEYFFALNFLDAAETIKAMNERRMDDYLFERWIPYQDQMSFDDFKSQTLKNKESRIDNRSAKEILQSVKKIIGSAHGGF